ncbi:MAG TPA: glycosyltransferase family 39 protein [Phycisphaerae bacterium]|nr:glycosyltransferase family 39 protein [Phycisphaerae bacterium]
MVFAANYYTVFDDEALSCRLYAMPMGDMMRALWRGDDPDPPIYYVLQNLSVKVFGVGPFALRFLSIVFFIASLPIIRRAGQAWFDRSTGLLAMIIAAIHPALLFFGFAGRWYALLFFLVAVLLTLSAPIRPDALRRSPRCLAWGLCAAAICYTNYFGPVVVGLTWLAVLIRDRSDGKVTKGWLYAASVAIFCYLPWMPTLWHNLTSFPAFGGSIWAHLAAAARIALVLLTGNLADPASWWVIVPLAAAVISLVAILIRSAASNRVKNTTVAVAASESERGVVPTTVAAGSPPASYLLLLLIFAGAALAGILSQTIIDKYSLTLAAPFVILLAGALTDAYRSTRGLFAKLPAAALVLAWLGCIFNLVTQRHWSSLRWLDPFESITRQLYRENWDHSRPDAVCSHPSARYYFARHRVTDSNRSRIEMEIQPDWRPTWRTDPAEWLAAWNEQDDAMPKEAYFALTPTAASALLEQSTRTANGVTFQTPLMLTLQTAGYADLPDWSTLHAALSRDFIRSDEVFHFLEDQAAEWKDRFDPAFKHPRWRITVEKWSRSHPAPDPG